MARRNSWNTPGTANSGGTSTNNTNSVPSRRRGSAWTNFSRSYTSNYTPTTSSGSNRKSFNLRDIAPFAIYGVIGLLVLAAIILFVSNSGDIFNAIGSGLSSLAEGAISILLISVLCWGALVYAFGRGMPSSMKTFLFVAILILNVLGLFIPSIQNMLIWVTVISFLVKFFSFK